MLGRSILHKLATAAERGVDAVLRDRDASPVLDGYRGFATPDRLILRGRVLSASRRTAPLPDQGRWANFRQMLMLFLTDEVADIAVEARGVTTRSDGEGYVWLEIPREGEAPGWHEIEVTQPGSGDPPTVFPVMVPSRTARFGIISDIDDTIMKTGAYSLARNLWTTFTGSALTRKVFPDAVVLMDHLHARGANPVFYVSSSPWNLHYFLEKVFKRAGLVTGPMFLRDFGVGTAARGANAHGSHKGDAIARILAANPDLPFLLLGDTGQHDAEIYHGVCERAGGRIRAVMLREAGRQGADDAARQAMAAMRNMGVTVHSRPNFEGAAEALAHAGIEI